MTQARPSPIITPRERSLKRLNAGGASSSTEATTSASAETAACAAALTSSLGG